MQASIESRIFDFLPDHLINGSYFNQPPPYKYSMIERQDYFSTGEINYLQIVEFIFIHKFKKFI